MRINLVMDVLECEVQKGIVTDLRDIPFSHYLVFLLYEYTPFALI